MSLIRSYLTNVNVFTRLMRASQYNVYQMSQYHETFGRISPDRLQLSFKPQLPKFNHSGINILQPTSMTWCVCRTYAKKGKDKGGKAHKKMTLTPEQLEGLVDMEKVRQDFTHVLDELKEQFIHHITVRTSQGVFDNLVVKTPEGNFPLIQLGQIVQKSPQLLTIDLTTSPQYIGQVKEALAGSGMNINPQQDGTSLFIPIPKVTREHRETLAKNAKLQSEKSKKHLRDVFSKYSKKIKSRDGFSADDLSAAEDMVKDLMHEVLNQIDEMTIAKQEELMGGK
ncbi:unnamed protein product [Lymnaea stagnalis]|uniref:Ribosome-recycling factor, mitochondrial n=1 Tax=Lymnaea stagnalis TaxID=6523 RepID=A0AAV2HVJ6_LYMST